MLKHPFNLNAWIDENRHLLKPPVGNKRLWTDSEFIIMVVGGPNSRKDFHYNEGEEFFYQLKGDITVKVQDNGQCLEIPINEGEVFLLPGRVPHNPCRPANTLGIVVERRRQPFEKDGLLWFCEKCNNKLYEEYFPLKNIETDFGTIFQKFYSSNDLRTCKNCGFIMEPPASPI